MQKSKFKLLFLFVILSIASFGQNKDRYLQKHARFNESTILLNIDSTYCSNYASNLKFHSVCNPFYILLDDKKNNVHVLGTTDNTNFHHEFIGYQSETVTSFDIDNSSTWVLTNEKGWTVFNLNMIRKNGWKPILISREEVDSVYLLEKGQFLTSKKNKKWFNSIDSLGQITTNEIYFEGVEIHKYTGGLIEPVIENDVKKYKYIQFQAYLYWNDSLQENLLDPTFQFLNSDGKFSADTLIVYPSERNDYAVIKNENSLQIYSFSVDAIIEKSLKGYYEVPYNQLLFYTDDYVATGNPLVKHYVNHPKSINLIDSGGDIQIVEIHLEDGSIINLDLFENKIIK
jgi:hypothetical protein